MGRFLQGSVLPLGTGAEAAMIFCYDIYSMYILLCACDYSAKPPENGFNPYFIFLPRRGRLGADGSEGEAAIRQGTSAHGSSTV